MVETAADAPTILSAPPPEAEALSPADRLALLASSRADLPEITRDRKSVV